MLFLTPFPRWNFSTLLTGAKKMITVDVVVVNQDTAASDEVVPAVH